VALDPANAGIDALPSVWPTRSFRHDVLPDNFAARMGLFSFDAGTPLTAGTWTAARAGAACAIMGGARSRGQHLAKETARLCTEPPARPPCRSGLLRRLLFPEQCRAGVQTLLDSGLQRVAVLDVDYHHGNGTQSIFYQRSDVLTVSLHGDPRSEYPFFLGHATSAAPVQVWDTT